MFFPPYLCPAIQRPAKFLLKNPDRFGMFLIPVGMALENFEEIFRENPFIIFQDMIEQI